MYIHKVTVTRPDTSNAFYYSSLLSSPVYVEFKRPFLESGKLLDETVIQSPDTLTMVRVLTFMSKEDFDEMMLAWAENNNFYVKKFLEYIEAHNHSVTFEVDTIPVSYMAYVGYTQVNF